MARPQDIGRPADAPGLWTLGGADLAKALPQPAMRGVGVHARMPQHRDGELRRRNWKAKAIHTGSQDACVPLGNGGDQRRAEVLHHEPRCLPRVTRRASRGD